VTVAGEKDGNEAASRAPQSWDQAPALRLWQHPAFLITLLGGVALALASDLWWPALQATIYEIEFAAEDWLDPALARAPRGLRYLALPAIGFAAGLLASISPCVLPMVPLNVAYIGAHEASGLRALRLSAGFALGAAFALSILGLAADLAGFLLVEQRGAVLLLSGLALAYFGLVVIELAPDPLGARAPFGTRRLGPFGAGAAFSLVTTPCTSPLLGAVLVASAANPAPGLSVLTVVAFSLGYTLLVFLGGVFGGGLVAAARRFDFRGPRAAAAGLLLVCGATFAWSGIRWF
jgi:cytochrome c-type biogenesis protein